MIYPSAPDTGSIAVLTARDRTDVSATEWLDAHPPNPRTLHLLATGGWDNQM